ncbi:MAG: glycosyltransferase family 2 protein, partial [Oscillospiraceae bacterium]|nr:glycosyltransferase family 2 protein [Oscillospiraceae bacterium]
MKPVFSVIIPCYNEQEVLSATWERLHGVMEGMGEPYELIFINDGSRDNTTKMLRELAAANPQVRALHFARNFGQQYAVTAGLDAARGDAVVIIDADLQDPPEVIPEMAEKWRAGADVVYGKRLHRA